MNRFLELVNKLQREAQKWSDLNKQHPDLTHKRNLKFLASANENVLDDMFENLHHMNTTYENKIRVGNQLKDFLSSVRELQKTLPENQGTCKIDSIGYINITNSYIATTFYVFEYNEKDNNFQLLRFLQRCNLGQCNTWANFWDENYYSFCDDGIPDSEESTIEYYDKPKYFTSEEILTQLKKDHK